MDENETHRKITEELYLEGVRGLLLEFALDIFYEKSILQEKDVGVTKEFIRNWVNSRFPEKIIEDKDSTTHE